MKKLAVLAALGFAGLMNAKGNELTLNVSKIEKND